MEKLSGIYCIRNIINNKVYIGKSINLLKRKTSHFSNLKQNKHKNFKLQGSINKYGIDKFIFEILEYCDNKDIDLKEIEYINKYNSSIKGYNIHSDIQHHSEEWLNKLRHLRKSDSRFIEQFKNCQSKADNRIKINEYDLEGEYIKTWNSITEASKFYNIDKSSVSAVLTFKRSKVINKMFRYFENTNNINIYKSFRKKQLKFISNNEELIFNSGKEVAEYFKRTPSWVTQITKKGNYNNYKIVVL